MRIAALVLGLFLTIGVLVQSCVVLVGSEVVSELDEQLGTGETAAELEEASGAAAVGILVAVMALVGAAFALGLPRVSAIAYGLGAILGIETGHSSEFTDLAVWGYLMIGLAALSYFGQRRERRWPLNRIGRRNTRPLPAVGDAVPQFCSQCGDPRIRGAQYCTGCGVALGP